MLSLAYLSEEALGVDHPDLADSLLPGQPLLHHGVTQQVGDTNRRLQHTAMLPVVIHMMLHRTITQYKLGQGKWII